MPQGALLKQVAGGLRLAGARAMAEDLDCAFIRLRLGFLIDFLEKGGGWRLGLEPLGPLGLWLRWLGQWFWVQAEALIQSPTQCLALGFRVSGLGFRV